MAKTIIRRTLSKLPPLVEIDALVGSRHSVYASVGDT